MLQRLNESLRNRFPKRERVTETSQLAQVVSEVAQSVRIRAVEDTVTELGFIIPEQLNLNAEQRTQLEGILEDYKGITVRV